MLREKELLLIENLLEAVNHISNELEAIDQRQYTTCYISSFSLEKANKLLKELKNEIKI